MADGLNQVILIGNIGADPEKKTVNGQDVMDLRLATSESYLDRDKVRQERTEWHNVTIWGKRATALHRILSKGEKICVIGSIRHQTWEHEGVKKYKTIINARDVKLLGGRGDGQGGQRRGGGWNNGGQQQTGGQSGGYGGQGGGGNYQAPANQQPGPAEHGGAFDDDGDIPF